MSSSIDEERESVAEKEEREAEARLFWIFPELKDSFCKASGIEARNMDRHSGVLWKRRDVFKNRWRPRWFALNPGQGILTYYLLTAPTPTPDPAEAVTPPRGGSRDRATSWDSQVSGVSESSLDYDVVPRGTIFLLGCTVSSNEFLSRPSDNLYAFTIKPPSSTESNVYLAARTPETRALWVEKLDRVCHYPSPRRTNPQTPSTYRTPPVRRLLTDHSIPEEEAEEEAVETAVTEQPRTSAWQVVGQKADLYTDLPESLVNAIEEKIEHFLCMCDNKDDGNWRQIFHHKHNGHSAYQCTDDKGRSIIKSHARIHFPALQVFNLIIDISKRHLYETNVQADERIKVLNSHTFMDFYSYRAVWPTSSREFAVCTHWRLVEQKPSQKAILMVSFSCPDSDAVKPVAPNHVRGQAIVSMILFREVNDHKCDATRLVCFDLGGNISHHLSNVIAAQQAGLPGVIEEFLMQHEPVIDNKFRMLLTYGGIQEHVIERVAKPTLQHTERPPSPSGPLDDSLIVAEDPAFEVETTKRKRPSLESQAIILLAPIIFHKALSIFGITVAARFFFILAFLAVRYVAILYSGDQLLSPETYLESVTCRFSVDLKGIHRFIANKREEREEFNSGKTEVAVVHIVVGAMVHAFRKEPILRQRRVRIPWLLIDRVVDASNEPLVISVSESTGDFVTLSGIEKRKVQDLADDLTKARDDTKTKSHPAGECIVVAVSNSEDPEMTIDALPSGRSVSILAIVGGIHQEPNASTPNGLPPFLRGPSHHKPAIKLSLTFRGHRQADIGSCRRFAEEFQKHLLFPEMCEG